MARNNHLKRTLASPRFGRLPASVFAVEVVEKFKNYSVSVTSSLADEVTVAFRVIPTRFFGM
jgi:hypothetical protein